MATNKTTIDEFITRIKNNTPLVYEKGVEEGKKAENDAFWDYYQNTTQYLYAFSHRWNDDIYKPKKDIQLVGSNCCSGMFYYSKITDTKVKITFMVAGNGLSSAIGFMNNATEMRTIREIVFNSSTTFNNTTFQNCTKLETMNVGGTIGQNGLNLQWSTLLTHDSLMSIINALADKTADTSGTEWTVTIGETNMAKLTADEIDKAEKKGWHIQ